jgi:hypothetical protein
MQFRWFRTPRRLRNRKTGGTDQKRLRSDVTVPERRRSRSCCVEVKDRTLLVATPQGKLRRLIHSHIPFGGGPPVGVRHPPASFALMMLLSGGARVAPHAARRRKTKEIGMRFQSLVWSERPPGCRCRLRGTAHTFDHSILAQSQNAEASIRLAGPYDDDVCKCHGRAKLQLETREQARVSYLGGVPFVMDGADSTRPLRGHSDRSGHRADNLCVLVWNGGTRMLGVGLARRGWESRSD